MDAAAPRADRAEIRRALDLMLAPGAVTELRLLDVGPTGTMAGYYDDREALAEEAARWSGRARGVYVCLNPLDPTLLAWSPNRLRERAADTVDHRDARWRRWFPVDIDPHRPGRISSTDAEHEAALAAARTLRGWFRGLGWPEPVLADSGNGAHLLYRVELPNDVAATRLVNLALAALDLRFTDRALIVDAGNGGAARCWKLYGTLAAKGSATPDRPHRLARILEAPAHLQPVAPEALAALPRTRPDFSLPGAR